MQKFIFTLVTIVVGALAIGAQTASAADDEKRNVAINKANTDGEAARKRGDYPAAIKIYDAAIAADPTHYGIPIIVMYKAISQMVIGQQTYAKGLQPKDDAKIKEAIKLLRDAAETGQKAVTAAVANKYTGEYLYSVLLTRKDTLHLAATADPTIPMSHVGAVFNDYFNVEKNAALLEKARNDYGNLLTARNENQLAQIQFKKVLAASPKNPAALYGMASSSFGLATDIASTSLYQEAANYAHQFMQVAAANDPMRENAAVILDHLKKEYNITPR